MTPNRTRLGLMLQDGCGGCVFYQPRETQSDIGLCHRHAPRPCLVVEGKDSISDRDAIWPTVLSDEFCGEWCAPPTMDDHETPTES